MKKIMMQFAFGIALMITLILGPYEIVTSAQSYTDEQQKVIDYVHTDKVPLQNFTQAEISHLNDVGSVIVKARLVFALALLIATITGVHLYKQNQIKKPALIASVSCISFITLFGILVLLSFDSIFSAFHAIFFSPGTWTFPENSKLIQLFPLDFFITTTKNILMIIIIASTVVFAGFKHEQTKL